MFLNRKDAKTPRRKINRDGRNGRSVFFKFISRCDRRTRCGSQLFFCALVSLWFIFATPALADTASTYAPEFCEFSITFPDEPYKTRRCDDGNQKCYDLVTFTQVYELAATVNFRVICNKISPEIKKTYDGEIMQATLRAMTEDKVVEHFETSFREEEHYKQAGLVGEGKVGRTPTLYIGQMWIGEHSAFTVEAELIGEANDAADTLYSDILKSIDYVDKTAAKEEQKEEEESN